MPTQVVQWRKDIDRFLITLRYLRKVQGKKQFNKSYHKTKQKYSLQSCPYFFFFKFWCLCSSMNTWLGLYLITSLVW